MQDDGKIRCLWARGVKDDYVRYHDTEWGVPVHDDRKHFEMLILEGAQAGLSWYSILKRREGYRELFKNFDPIEVARMSDEELEELLLDERIIRNRLKIFAARSNARVFLEIQGEFNSFDNYIWRFVDHKIKINNTTRVITSDVSDALSKDLKKRGMSFVGSTIIYAHMQAIGMVNDHSEECFRQKEVMVASDMEE